jgi:hypothetical protein
MIGKCEHCGKIFYEGDETHHCSSTGEDYTITHDSDGSFLLSAAIGYATHSVLAGALLGGDVLGAVFGDLL